MTIGLEHVTRDPEVRAALRRVPRERFVPPALRDAATEDRALPIGEGQTISQPSVVALMTELCALDPGARVLEVGTGSGYQTAVLAELAREVYSVERIPSLHEVAKARLAALGYENVRLRLGDGAAGWPEHAPYDAIIVTAAPSAIPRALLAQLALGGRLVIPVGGRSGQMLVVVTRTEDGFAERAIVPVIFVPLVAGVDGSDARRG